MRKMTLVLYGFLENAANAISAKTNTGINNIWVKQLCKAVVK